MKFGTKDLSRYGTLYWLLPWIFLLLATGTLGFWTDSEMWPVAATKYLFSGRIEYYFGTKPLFHFLLFLNQYLALGLGAHPMDTARALMAINTCGLLSAFFLILRRHHGPRLAYFGLAFLFSLSFFVKRIGHVRSDEFVCTIFLWILYLWPTLSDGRQKIAFILGSVVAGLITPKAVLWILACWPLYLDAIRKNKKIRYALVGGLAIVLIAIAASTRIRLYFMDPLDFFFRSFKRSEDGFPYFGIVRWQHVFQTAVESPHFVLLYLFNLSLFMKRKLTIENFPGRIQLIGWSLFILLLVYPDRLPFLISALLPFFTLQIFLNPVIAQKILSLRKEWAMIAVGACFLISLHWCLKILASHNSNDQRHVAKWLQIQVDHLPKEIRIYDPIGVLPHQRADYWFLGPGQNQKNANVMDYIRRFKPEIILFPAKLMFLEPEINQYLGVHYTGDRAGIFVRRFQIVKPREWVTSEQIKEGLKEEFPRIADKDMNWDFTLRDESGLEIPRVLARGTLDIRRGFSLPPHVVKVIIQPFSIKLPFNRDLATLYSFDSGF